jgi:hypothetical protein
MWKMILKRSGKMTDRSKKLVDSVITTTPKSISTIFDDMYNEIDKMKGKNINEKNQIGISGRNLIPTRTELAKYLSSNYSVIHVSKRTEKPAIGGEARYYRK